MKASTLALIIMLIIPVVFQSCDKKNCENVICSIPNSTCVDGNCYCIAGYEGDNCEILSYEKYIGSYNVTESCTTSNTGPVNQNYISSITPGFDIDIITINNFSQFGLPVHVNIIDATYLLIQEQNSGSVQVSGGEGFYQFGNQIRFEYNYTVSGSFRSCTATFTKF
jgi:hypothetical protein